jgi:penicillin-binding protein 1C
MRMFKFYRNLIIALLITLMSDQMMAGVIKKNEFQTFNEVKNGFVPSDVKILDRNGKTIERFRFDKTERSLPWISLNEVSHAFKTLLLKSEDKNFYEHAGVDWRALVKAGYDHLTKDTKRGASTITMQLVGLIDASVSRRRVSVNDKIEQIKKALYLEKNWTKEEILEAYVNLAAFRGELLGLGSVSMGYFNKSPSTLSLEESSILVALLRSPNADAELVGKRACQLLELSSCLNLQKKTEKLFLKSYNIERQRKYLSVIDNSFVKKQNDKSFIQTSLDLDVQEKAVNDLKEQIRFYQDQNVSDGAILVIDNKTGEVITYVANAGIGYSSSPNVDGIRARRQAGSTLKPFVYATAIEMNMLDQQSLIEDSPIDIVIGNGSIYYPRNYDETFKGIVTLGEALGSSLNVPAVKTLQLVGGERVVVNLKKLGFKAVREASYYGPSLALGSVDITLWDLTQAYRKLFTSKVFSSKTQAEIFQMLSKDENRRLTFGTGSVLSLPFPTAVKTGTSKDMRDNWCVGVSDRYTVGVWVGNFSGKAMWNVSGVTGAAPLWRSVMLALHQNDGGAIKRLSQKQRPLHIPVIKSDESTQFKKQISTIKYPVHLEVVGFDPEIPISNQKLPIEIDNPRDDLEIYLNEKFFSKAQALSLWSIERGKFHLKLIDSNKKIVDEVRFEVR